MQRSVVPSFPFVYPSPFTDQASHQRGEKQGAADRGVWALKASGCTIDFCFAISIYKTIINIHSVFERERGELRYCLIIHCPCWKAAAINQLGMAEWSNVVLVDMMHGAMLGIVPGPWVLGFGPPVTSDFVQDNTLSTCLRSHHRGDSNSNCYDCQWAALGVHIVRSPPIEPDWFTVWKPISVFVHEHC